MDHAVFAQGLGKRYPVGGRPWRRRAERSVEALRDVDLQIGRGEIFGVVGRNGYGKTTLIKCVASLLDPSAGSLEVLGLDPRVAGAHLRRRIGWVGADDRSFYFRLTGRQNLEFFGRLQGLSPAEIRSRADELAEQLDLGTLLDRRFHEYSTGNRQRLAVLRALLHGPELLILDEPTRSLDPFGARVLWACLRAWIAGGSGRTILITSHNLAEIESVSHRVAVMGRGRIQACGAVASLRETLGVQEIASLCLDRSPDPAQLASLPAGATWEPTQGDVGAGWLRVPHNPGDPQLDGTIRAVLDAGLRVMAVQHAAPTLQDVVDRMGEEPGGG